MFLLQWVVPVRYGIGEGFSSRCRGDGFGWQSCPFDSMASLVVAAVATSPSRVSGKGGGRRWSWPLAVVVPRYGCADFDVHMVVWAPRLLECAWS